MSAKRITTLLLIALAAIGGYFYFFARVRNLNVKTEVTKVASNKINVEDINFTHTDDNTDEDLIIKSDKNTYYDFSKIKVYFSVTSSKKSLNLNEEKIGLRLHYRLWNIP